MTKLCNSCEYLKYCARSGIEEVGCDRYKRDTTTNKEWLRSATTEQLAEILLAIYQDGIDDCKQEWWKDTKEDFVEWLKQPHTFE